MRTNKLKKHYKLLTYDGGHDFYLVSCSDNEKIKVARLDEFGNIKLYVDKSEIPEPYYKALRRASIDTKMVANKNLKLYTDEVQYKKLMQSLPDGFFLELLHKYKAEQTPLEKRIKYLKKCYQL